MHEGVSQTPSREKLNAVTGRFVATAQAIVNKHGVRTESDGFDGPFHASLKRVSITTPGVPDDFNMVLARVRLQQDYHRELTPEELKSWEDDAEAKREGVPVTLRLRPTKEEIETLHKEAYIIETSDDGGYKWDVCIAVRTVDYGKPANLAPHEVKEKLNDREYRLETLKKIDEALDQQATEKQKQG